MTEEPQWLGANGLLATDGGDYEAALFECETTEANKVVLSGSVTHLDGALTVSLVGVEAIRLGVGLVLSGLEAHKMGSEDVDMSLAPLINAISEHRRNA